MQFDFENYLNKDAVHYDNGDDNDSNCEEEIDEEIDQSQQIFEFITVPSFASLPYGTTIEPLFYAKNWKRWCRYLLIQNISDPYGHFIAKGEKYFRDCSWN